MKKILIPVDYSDSTDRVLEHGLEMSREMNALPFLVHVSTPRIDSLAYSYAGGFVYDVPMMTPGPTPDSEEIKMEQKLEDLAEPARSRGQDVRTIHRCGMPSEQILQVAEELPADIIILGSHGHGALYHMLLGSVSEAIMHKAMCPVMIVPARRLASPSWKEAFAGAIFI